MLPKQEQRFVLIMIKTADPKSEVKVRIFGQGSKCNCGTVCGGNEGVLYVSN